MSWSKRYLGDDCGRTAQRAGHGESSAGEGDPVDQPTGTLYATHMPCDAPRDRIYVYDGAGGAPLAAVPEAENAVGLAVNERTRTLYAALLRDGETRGALGVVDLRHCHAGDTSGCGTSPAGVPAGLGSLRVAVDQRSHGIYVANDEDAGVSVFDGWSCRAGRTTGCWRPPALVLADDYPAALLALAPSVGTAYVTSAAAGTVALVPMKR